MRCFSVTRPRARILTPRAPRRVETSGNASPEPAEPLELQKFELGGREGEKRAHQIISDLLKVARRRP